MLGNGAAGKFGECIPQAYRIKRTPASLKGEYIYHTAIKKGDLINKPRFFHNLNKHLCHLLINLDILTGLALFHALCRAKGTQAENSLPALLEHMVISQCHLMHAVMSQGFTLNK